MLVYNFWQITCQSYVQQSHAPNLKTNCRSCCGSWGKKLLDKCTSDRKKVIWGAVGPLIKQPRNKLLLSSIFLPNLFSAPDLY